MEAPYPTIALLKGGTMNNIARNIGVGFWTSAESLLKTIAAKRKTPYCIAAASIGTIERLR